MLNAGLKTSQLQFWRRSTPLRAMPAKEVPYGAIICPFTHSLHKTVRIMALEANMPNVTFLEKIVSTLHLRREKRLSAGVKLKRVRRGAGHN